MKTFRICNVRWVTWAGITMASIALAIFMAFTPSQTYAFNGCTCLKDGAETSQGGCSGGQRCHCDPDNNPVWLDDANCPAN